MKTIYFQQNRTASFDVDAEKCFTPLCPEELSIEDGHLIVESLNFNATKAILRIGSKDWHLKDAVWVATEQNPQFSKVDGNHKNVDIHWNLHGVGGTFGAELLNGLPAEEDYDYFIWKGMEKTLHPYGACYHDLEEKLSTGVIEYLHFNKIETVIVGGLALDHCVKRTALQLNKAGFKVIINLESTKGITKESVKEAILEMKEAGVIVLDNLDNVVFS